MTPIVEVVRVVDVRWHKTCETDVIHDALRALERTLPDEAVRIKEDSVKLKSLLANVHTVANRLGIEVKTRRIDGYLYIARKSAVMPTKWGHLAPASLLRGTQGRYRAG